MGGIVDLAGGFHVGGSVRVRGSILLQDSEIGLFALDFSLVGRPLDSLQATEACSWTMRTGGAGELTGLSGRTPRE